MWENLVDPSSSSGEEGNDGEESKDAASTGAPENLGGGSQQFLDEATGKIERRDDALESERHDQQGVRGWVCEVCTFWNDVIAEGGDEGPRCGMCDADGPSNAGSPWVTA